MKTQTQAKNDKALIVVTDIQQHRGWFLAIGVLILLLGIAAIIFPFTASLAVTAGLGIVLAISGVVQLAHAFGVRRLRGFFFFLISALLSLMAGILLLIFPVSGMLSLTLVVGSFLLIGGILKIFLALRIRPGVSWSWLLFAGGLALVLGTLILLQWPAISSWVLGLMVGVDLLFSGWWLLMLGAANRNTLETGDPQHS